MLSNAKCPFDSLSLLKRKFARHWNASFKLLQIMKKSSATQWTFSHFFAFYRLHLSQALRLLQFESISARSEQIEHCDGCKVSFYASLSCDNVIFLKIVTSSLEPFILDTFLGYSIRILSIECKFWIAFKIRLKILTLGPWYKSSSRWLDIIS